MAKKGQKVGTLVSQIDQWPFQEPKLEVPTPHKAYVGIYRNPQNLSLYGLYRLYGTVPPF